MSPTVGGDLHVVFCGRARMCFGMQELAPDEVKEDPFESGEAGEAAEASSQVKAEPEDAAMDGGGAVGLGESAEAGGTLPEDDEHAEVEEPQEEAVQMPATQDDPGSQLGVCKALPIEIAYHISESSSYILVTLHQQTHVQHSAQTWCQC